MARNHWVGGYNRERRIEKISLSNSNFTILALIRKLKKLIGIKIIFYEFNNKCIFFKG